MGTWLALLVLAFQLLPQRKMPVAILGIGVGVTVGIFTIIVAMAESLTRTLQMGSDPSTFLVLSEGAQWEGSSFLSRELYARMAQAKCIAERPGGTAHFGPVALAAVTLFGPDGSATGLEIRGIQPKTFPEATTLVAGRWPRAGLHELAVGSSAEQEVPGAALGDEVLVNARTWPIVGVFTTDSALAGAFITDAESLVDAYGRQGYNVAVGKLDPECTFDLLTAELESLGVDVDVVPSEVYLEQVNAVIGTFRLLAIVVGIPMAIGAACCSFGVAATVVHTRRRDLMLLLALGLGPSSVAGALVAEIVVIAAACSAVASTLAAFAMSGQLISVGVELTSLIFEWRSSFTMYLTGIATASLTSMFGALVPTVRVVRMDTMRVMADHV